VTSLAFTSTVDVDLQPRAADEIGLVDVTGDANLMVHELRSTNGAEGSVWAAVVTVDPCSFSYDFAGDETLHVLEGEATVVVDGSLSVELSAGVIASFRRGTRSHWTIHSHFREFAVVTEPLPVP
jgi:uncharacterized cupin superfamily protein